MAHRRSRSITYVKSAAAVIGALSSAGLHALAGDPVSSSMAGAALGALLDDVGTRHLSARERSRIKTATSFAAKAIEDRYVLGHDYRTDGFFASDPYTRSSFEEVAEGVLLAAQKEHEELKVPFMGYLIANIAYEEDVNRPTANWAIRTSSDLSWTQLVLLALIEDKDYALPAVNLGKNSPSWESWGVHQELVDLHSERRLIGAPTGRTERIGLPYINSNLAEMKLTNGGKLLFHLMRLDEIHTEALDEAFDRLSMVDPQATNTAARPATP